MTREHIDAVREVAALYALGGLSAEEAHAFEERLQSDPTCQAELAAFRAVVHDLAYAVPPQGPPPGLRAKLLQRIAAEEAAVVDQDGLRFVRSAQLGWEPGAAPGVEVKKLFADPSGARTTKMYRMAPGSTYPAHRHAGVEDIYVIDGDLLVNGVQMRAGDYCRAEANSLHHGIQTASGCLFIATASERNQLLD
jgi:anti-sigma factor ChrR (cupin superfamily)